MADKSFPFMAVCGDCGNVADESYDNKPCECGGVYHVNSARCLKCGKRHPFNMVGQPCSCGEQGVIAPKAASCPSCNSFFDHKHLGESCPICNVPLRVEG